MLHIGYFLILPGLDADGLAERFARSRKAGTFTFLDVVTPGPADYLEPLRKVLPHTDIFVPNTDEAALILGEDDPVRQALAFHDMGAKRVVITRGEHGLISVFRRGSPRAGGISRSTTSTAPAAGTPSMPATSRACSKVGPSSTV